MMAEELVTISVRVRKDQAREIEALAANRGVDRSAAVRELLTVAIQEAKLTQALEPKNLGLEGSPISRRHIQRHA
jgi:metal-responsive CopG/Arc/MetJ family transcriptional regulator